MSNYQRGAETKIALRMVRGTNTLEIPRDPTYPGIKLLAAEIQPTTNHYAYEEFGVEYTRQNIVGGSNAFMTRWYLDSADPYLELEALNNLSSKDGEPTYIVHGPGVTTLAATPTATKPYRAFVAKVGMFPGFGGAANTAKEIEHTFPIDGNIEEFTADIVTPTTTPSGPTSTTIDLSWPTDTTLLKDGVTPRVTYKVYQALSSGGQDFGAPPAATVEAVVTTDPTVVTITGLSPSTAYFFVVHATDPWGFLVAGAEATETTTA